MISHDSAGLLINFVIFVTINVTLVNQWLVYQQLKEFLFNRHNPVIECTRLINNQVQQQVNFYVYQIMYKTRHNFVSDLFSTKIDVTFKEHIQVICFTLRPG